MGNRSCALSFLKVEINEKQISFTITGLELVLRKLLLVFSTY